MNQAASRFTLSPPAPFRLDLTVWVLRRQAHNQIDDWDGEIYRRAWQYAGNRLEVRLWQTQAGRTSLLEGEIRGNCVDASSVAWVSRQLSWMLGLDQDLRPFYAMAASDLRLAALADRFQGFRPPRFSSLFEALSNAIACQQLSLHVGILLLNRMARLCSNAPEATNSFVPFPNPATLLQQEAASLRSLGFSIQKAKFLQGIAESAAASQLARENWQDLSNSEAAQRLHQLRGIGRWSTEYVLLRGLGRLNVFPGDDVGARKALYQWLEEKSAPDYTQVAKRLQPWQPYAGVLYFLLLLNRLEKEGHIP
ncbi:DNA-3-methyladenine glycosylase 2 [Acidithiobacillus thiooxidans]|uniref:DNA-3-methyladenine glycosylase II n=1 Tax=Acidithiobacillus thiooxidans ATCC 19377 TaxID=637390 RepID=A0A543Q426_ACITH|nr:DNA-3-methyladenine glycosylase 2 [Acidithiobacillus thiooxidans]MDX5934792.1 DNA-3-methyladenine glycosylase 2 [Acidithiobacillus thiooxidans]TQN51083.1 DNA-3-methyladenine glycosylase [Acidithiobacillus thiooxidans ATCC 19377]